MSDDIRKQFEDLVKKYVKDLAAVEEAGLAGSVKANDLLEGLVDDLESSAADHWYSSSADC